LKKQCKRSKGAIKNGRLKEGGGQGVIMRSFTPEMKRVKIKPVSVLVFSVEDKV